jgi:hypothetical protein
MTNDENSQKSETPLFHASWDPQNDQKMQLDKENIKIVEKRSSDNTESSRKMPKNA